MAIPEEDVARVRAATDIVALIGEHAALKRQGTRWTGLCPFHQEKSPSFSVNAEAGLYYCFGCQTSGDAISFVRQVEHLDFVEAVRRLADRAGVTITEDAAVSAERQRRNPLYDAMTKAVDFYHQRLLSAPDGGPARDYLRSRGYDGEVVRAFQLGWAPDAWDALAVHLKVSERVLSESGLGFVNRRGRPQDAFRARVIFPIFDSSGKAIALGGRILPGRAAGAGGGGGGGRSDGPKYKNSQDGPIYAKRRTLYGLNWAKADVVASGEVIVCEGYTDVIAFAQVGLPRAVATCGTALGEEHFRVLGNFATRVVLAYDADSAGEAGANRVYEWERHHRVDVAVAALPPGADPADLARTDPEALRRAVSEAQPFLRFRIERVLAAADLRTNEGRAKAADAALTAVADHPDVLVRDQYLMGVADRCRLDAATLRPLLDDLVRRAPERAASQEAAARRQGSARDGAGRADADHVPSRGPGGGVGSGPDDDGAATSDRPSGARSGPSEGQAQRAGLEALRLVVHQPASMADRLHPLLFSDERQRATFATLDAAGDLHGAIGQAEDEAPDVAVLLRRLAVEEPAADADDVVVQLVWNATRRALADLESESRLSPDAFAELSRVSALVHADLEELKDGDEGIKAADRLLAWLIERGEDNA